MLNSKYKRYLANPLIGLTAFLVYLLLHRINLFSEAQAIAIAVGVVLAMNLWSTMVFRSRIYCLTYYVVALALFITFLVWLFDKYIDNQNLYLIICELAIVCLFIIIKLNKRKISIRFIRKKASIHKIYYTEYLRAITVAQYCLSAHLFLTLFYDALIPSGFLSEPIIFILYTLLPSVIVVLLISFEMFKIHAISVKLNKEEWLPIVTEEGGVIGKIAKSETVLMTTQYLHPVVRVALISDGKFFLQERTKKSIIDPLKVDYPFEKYVLFNSDIDKAVRNSIKRILGYELKQIPKFVLRYTYENEKTKRLILLYYIYVKDINSIKRTKKMHGKFWTLKQIEDGFADNVFGENFELEFEYLKNTIDELKLEGSN